MAFLETWHIRIFTKEMLAALRVFWRGDTWRVQCNAMLDVVDGDVDGELDSTEGLLSQLVVLRTQWARCTEHVKKGRPDGFELHLVQ
jgi:hypothetical protein